MSVLTSNTFLENLIQTGPDASLNLFAVNFKKHNSPDYDNKLSLRVTNFPTPSRNIQTASLKYQNIEIKTLAPSSDISREVTFNVRIDEDFRILKSLRDMQAINKYGHCLIGDENYSYTITVDALRPYKSLTYSEKYITTYRWIFYDAYITTIGNATFSYDSANAMSVPVTFVYKYFDESAYDVSQENKSFANSVKNALDRAFSHKEESLLDQDTETD